MMKTIIWFEVVILAPFIQIFNLITSYFTKLTEMADNHAEYGFHVWDRDKIIKHMQTQYEIYLKELEKNIKKDK